MQMPNSSGCNKPVPHYGDNTLGHTKDISNITVILFGEEILNEIYLELACCRKKLPALYLGLKWEHLQKIFLLN